MQYVEMLRRSPLRLRLGQVWAAETYDSQLVEQAYRSSSLLFDDVDVAEFTSPGILGD